MPDTRVILILLFLPLLSFLINGLFGRKLPGSLGGLLATATLFVSFLLSLSAAYSYFFGSVGITGAYETLIPFQVTWLQFSESFSINMGILADPISMMMIVVVTFISLMVHVFSLGYMKGEERFATYYSFLSLFTFSMLGLVLSSNIFQTYIFWELVGVSSFLLIGYYYQKPSAVAASKKAFIVTRFADLGFLIGILILSYYGKSFDFVTLTERLVPAASTYSQAAAAAGFLGISALTWALVLIFVGGAGKSAMFPLHIWLPDAMEGPTPVSALIHAATMVVAGVYLVARLFPIFSLACPGALDVVAWTGIISALFAALIACTQTDIKRVLAYSTMSQIGYMMFALGVSGYGAEEGLGYMAAMFHLFTHAMFKALLFLGAGVIIHYVHSNDLKDMGGLRKALPITGATFLIACLAIAGIPPFSGFFSKEEILLSAYNSNYTIYIIALITAGLTAFYMFRLYFSIFWNKPQVSANEHKHEGTLSMLIPLLILAVFAAFSGFIPFSSFVTSDGIPFETHLHLEFSILPVLLSVSGIAIAWRYYKKPSTVPASVSQKTGSLYRTINKKFYIDEIYLFVTKKLVFQLIARPAAWFDKTIVDGMMNTAAAAAQVFSLSISGLQSGKLQHYAYYFIGGAIGLAILFIYSIA
ncbi:MAG: NADH-quinone oxidoreductase subunit L [Bacteroidetes bacterium]|nr:MAG: NADH-quinone oxidoreductase subunit L [Bacteroidota bacterium]